MKRFLPFLVFNLCLSAAMPLLAEEGDTTVVTTFVNQNHNNGSSGRTHEQTFSFPDGSVEYNQVTLELIQSCPTGGCDPWDRLAHISVVRATSDTTDEYIEIARYVTPYNIVGGGGPGTCAWYYDVTDYLPILRDSVTLRSFVDTWIGNPQGWRITANFYFIEGQLTMKPYKVINLWNFSYIVYGDPANPPENYLDVFLADLDDYTEAVTFRAVSTGHGQGNTNNAAEFSHKDHGVWIGEEYFQHELWRDNCEFNSCSPQGGTWTFDRAGWCPGDKVWPWDITNATFTPGQSLSVWYTIEAYENFCRPSNPDCQNGVTCSDCNYNNTGHTEPYYSTTGQLILWSSQVPSDVPSEPATIPQTHRLEQNFPNPFNPETMIQFSLPTEEHIQLSVYDITGRLVKDLVNGRAMAGHHAVRFDGADLPSGVYIYSFQTQDFSQSKKMVLIK